MLRDLGDVLADCRRIRSKFTLEYVAIIASREGEGPLHACTPSCQSQVMRGAGLTVAASRLLGLDND